MKNGTKLAKQCKIILKMESRTNSKINAGLTKKGATISKTRQNHEKNETQVKEIQDKNSLAYF